MSNTASDDQRSEGRDRASQDERDRQAAQKLLKLLKDNPDVSRDMSTLRQCFGVKRFTTIRKAEVERALAEAGIKVTPSLQSRLRSKRLISLGTVDAPGETDSNEKNDLGGKTESHRNGESLTDRIKRHDLRVLAWVSAILGVVGIAIVVVPPWLAEPPPPPRMTGDLNIAVTPFTKQGRVTQEGVLLAEAASQDLRARVKDIEPALQVDLRGPGDSGITAVSDASAPALAERINADIVLHGSLQENSTGTTVSARFYLNRAKLPSAGELAGNYDYGTTIRAPFALSISPQTRADVRARLVSETDDVATFLAAVGDYLTHKYGLAQSHLDEVLRGTARTDVRALALVLLGNVFAQENHPLRARALYAEAADYPITHARATYGKAEVQYAIARGTCTGRHVDVRGLQQARAAFANVPLDRSAAVPPASIALLRAKVAFGLGQVELCLSHSGSIDNWRQARGEMESVVASYRSNVPELRDDAAEAYAGIGLADLHLQPVDYAAASAAYTKAGQLTSIDARRMFFARMAAYASAHPSESN